MVSSLGNDVKLRNTNFAQTRVTPINFCANSTNSLERTPEKDTIETKKEEKKGLSKAAKWGLGIAGTIGTLVLTMSLISRHQTKALTKLYKEKMVFKELPEKLEFKEAKTLDEALKFAKETLGIEKIDKNITLDAMNYVNRGIVDVSNANKGRLFVPKIVSFKNTKENFIACVDPNIKTKHFGELTLNKGYFDNGYLNKYIQDHFKYNNGKKMFLKEGESVAFSNFDVWYSPTNKLRKILLKFYKNPDSISIKEKRDLVYGYWQASQNLKNTALYRPDNFYNEIIKKYGKQKYTIQEFKALDLKEQSEILKTTLKKHPLERIFDFDSGLKTMYHEMGHLQDFAKNLKELDLKKWDFDFIKICKESWKEAKLERKTGIKKDNKVYEYVDNRWGGSTYDGYKDLLKNNPKKFQEKYPDLYKHLTDKEIQNITGQVSWYSQTSIGEFIAEVYAGLIKGEKYSDEVINLYKKYNGPLLPCM